MKIYDLGFGDRRKKIKDGRTEKETVEGEHAPVEESEPWPIQECSMECEFDDYHEFIELDLESESVKCCLCESDNVLCCSVATDLEVLDYHFPSKILSMLELPACDVCSDDGRRSMERALDELDEYRYYSHRPMVQELIKTIFAVIMTSPESDFDRRFYDIVSTHFDDVSKYCATVMLLNGVGVDRNTSEAHILLDSMNRGHEFRGNGRCNLEEIVENGTSDALSELVLDVFEHMNDRPHDVDSLDYLLKYVGRGDVISENALNLILEIVSNDDILLYEIAERLLCNDYNLTERESLRLYLTLKNNRIGNQKLYLIIQNNLKGESDSSDIIHALDHRNDFVIIDRLVRLMVKGNSMNDFIVEAIMNCRLRGMKLDSIDETNYRGRISNILGNDWNHYRSDIVIMH